jgi:hypothetical protein
MTDLAVDLPKQTGGSDLCKLAAGELADSTGLMLISETERLFLGQIHRCIFALEGSIAGTAAAPAKATFGFAGFLKKLDLRVVHADNAAQCLADMIIASPQVQREIAPLDLRRLELDVVADHWRLRAMLVGAAFVDMRLPPTRRYIPLGEIQAKALPRALRAISAILQSYFAR